MERSFEYKQNLQERAVLAPREKAWEAKQPVWERLTARKTFQERAVLAPRGFPGKPNSLFGKD